MIRSIINWELWHKLKGKDRKINTEYLFKKEKRMGHMTIEVCLGVGMNQIFPEYTKIEIPQLSKKEEHAERERRLAEMMKLDQDLGLYDELPHGEE